MQMKKNYLLLFFIALLFGIGTLPGKAAFPEPNIKEEFYFKIGQQYIGIKGSGNNLTLTLVADKGQAKPMKFGADSNSSSLSIGYYRGLDSSGKSLGMVSLKYTKAGKISPIGATNLYFRGEEINGKYYLKSTQVSDGQNGYLTAKNGKFSLEPTPTNDAIFAFENVNGDNPTEKFTELLKKLSFFQSYRYSLGDQHEDSPFIGTGIGQYPRPNLPHKDSSIGDQWTYFSYKMFRNTYLNESSADLIKTSINIINNCEKHLQINKLLAGTYVVISTKSQYEDKIRLNDNRSNELNFTPGSAAGPSLRAQYLMASAEGYKLTDDKSKAAVFYFDGQHLTGIDNGFGLGTPSYTQTENDQKAVIAQGKLEKTLDAGSYSLKVGDKFVKLDRTGGLSPSTSESDSHLFLEEATKFTLNTDELGYISFFAPTAVKVPAGVEVYRGNINAQNSVITFNKVNTQQIPANTAVLLRKVTGKGSFEVEKTASTTSTIGNNSLKGYTVSSSDHLSNAYGLTVENNKLVFKPLTQGVRAFRAVIYSNTAAGAPAYYPTAFTPEGIQGVTVDDNQAEVFDLAGRRVEAPVKGQVYVKNGKKFIQK